MENLIYIYNLSTSKETRITIIEPYKFDPDIYGDRIVWKDYRNGSDIYMYDLSSRDTQITPTESAIQARNLRRQDSMGG